MIKILKNIAFWKTSSIFLSSTYNDLIKERFTISEELNYLGYKVIKMEDIISGIDDIDVVSWSMDNAKDADIYLCLLSFRYGTRVSAEEDLSITSLELVSGAHFGKLSSITYLLEKPFYDEELLLKPKGFVENTTTIKSNDIEKIKETVGEIEVDALMYEFQYADYPSIAFTQQLDHSKQIEEELKKTPVPGEFMDEILRGPDDISEEELMELNKKRNNYLKKERIYNAMYPNIRDKENILKNIRNALLNSSIYRRIDSTQALMKYLEADIKLLANYQRIKKATRFILFLVSLITIAVVFAVV